MPLICTLHFTCARATRVEFASNDDHLTFDTNGALFELDSSEQGACVEFRVPVRARLDSELFDVRIAHAVSDAGRPLGFKNGSAYYRLESRAALEDFELAVTLDPAIAGPPSRGGSSHFRIRDEGGGGH